MKISPMVSVIIPTYNRANMLTKVLPSYLQSSAVCEVLVVDDGSSDDTANVANKFQNSSPCLRIFSHDRNLGIPFARNTGIENVQGKLVLFSEDDLSIAPGALEVLVSHMEKTGADIIAGRRIWMRMHETEAQALTRANQNQRPVVNKRLLDHNSHAITSTDVEAALVDATMLVRREVVERVQFANCYLGNAWREESDFQLTAQELGFKVFFCPHALFYHHARYMIARGRSRYKSDLVFLYWIFKNNHTFLRRHRAFLREKIPESIMLGSPLVSSMIYTLYRSVWLTQAELRRVWRLRQHEHSITS